MFLEQISERVIGAAIEVHRTLGPGLLESIYEFALAEELQSRGIPFERQKAVPIRYKDVVLDGGLRLDFVVAGEVVVELKSVERLIDIHQSQLVTCLRLIGCRVGLLINFNVPVLKHGIRRIVLGAPD